MTRSELITRPLSAAERRWLGVMSARRERFLFAMGPYVVLLIGILFFGSLWGLSVLATKADRSGPSWRVFGLFWLVLGIVIALWSYRDVKRHIHGLQEKFLSALRHDAACEIRVRANTFVAYESRQNRKKGWYAFQTDDGCVVFIRSRFCQRLRMFPTSDFSMVDIADEKGNVIAGYAKNHGQPVTPSRSISDGEAARLRTPDHMEIVSGNLKDVETLLGART